VDTHFFDAIATVRLLGRYTLAGLTIPARNPLSTAPHRGGVDQRVEDSDPRSPRAIVGVRVHEAAPPNKSLA